MKKHNLAALKTVDTMKPVFAGSLSLRLRGALSRHAAILKEEGYRIHVRDKAYSEPIKKILSDSSFIAIRRIAESFNIAPLGSYKKYTRNIRILPDAEATESDWSAVGDDLIAARQAELRKAEENNAG